MDNNAALLRRYEDDLYVSGTGVLIMGLWGVIKAVLLSFSEYKDLYHVETGDPKNDLFVTVFTVIFMAVILILILWFHAYVGLNAMRAAKGKKYKKGYYTGAIILLILLVSTFYSYVEMFKDLVKIDTNIASVLVDLTTVYVLVMVIVSSNRIKKLKL